MKTINGNKKEVIKTHNIDYLLMECSKLDEDFKDIDPKNLTDFGVDIRYPGDLYEPTEKEIQEYKSIVLQIKNIVENKISL